MTAASPPLPPRLLPILYVGAAHVALAFAFGAVAIDPRGVAGFFYHPRMLAVVHLITLGWITTSILGSLYLVGPIALRTWIPAARLDYAAFALVAAGVAGMVVDFCLQQYRAVAWSAVAVATGVTIVGARVARRLRGAPLPAAISAHIVLAFLNLLTAASVGVLVAFDKVYHFLPGFVLTNVFAHAHMAVIGFASMMVIGVASRLLPMVLPAAMPAGPGLWTSAVLLEAGVLGLFVTLLLRGSQAWVWALVVIAGFGAFVVRVAWMLRRPRPRARGLRRPDPAVLHAAASFVWLAARVGARAVADRRGGLTGHPPCCHGLRRVRPRRLPRPDRRRHGRPSSAGVRVVLGLCQYRVRGPGPSPHDMPWRQGQMVVFVLWLLGVPALAAGLAFDAVPIVGAAAGGLLLATLVDSINAAWILRHAFPAPKKGSGVFSLPSSGEKTPDPFFGQRGTMRRLLRPIALVVVVAGCSDRQAAAPAGTVRPGLSRRVHRPVPDGARRQRPVESAADRRCDVRREQSDPARRRRHVAHRDGPGDLPPLLRRSRGRPGRRDCQRRGTGLEGDLRPAVGHREPPHRRNRGPRRSRPQRRQALRGARRPPADLRRVGPAGPASLEKRARPRVGPVLLRHGAQPPRRRLLLLRRQLRPPGARAPDDEHAGPDVRPFRRYRVRDAVVPPAVRDRIPRLRHPDSRPPVRRHRRGAPERVRLRLPRPRRHRSGDPAVQRTASSRCRRTSRCLARCRSGRRGASRTASCVRSR